MARFSFERAKNSHRMRIFGCRQRDMSFLLLAALPMVAMRFLIVTVTLFPTSASEAFMVINRESQSLSRPARHSMQKMDLRLQKWSSPRHMASAKNHGDKEEESRIQRQHVPRHVAFVCDGNSRWAKQRLLPTAAGHAAGADRLIQVLEYLQQFGVECCTLYGFSTENWKRPQAEIAQILTVMEQTAKKFSHLAISKGVQIKILGDLDDERIPNSLRDTLRQLERDTTAEAIPKQHDKKEQKMTVCIAINYGGRRDILNASLKLAQAISKGDLDPSNIAEDDFASFLCTADNSDPDLIVRTGGEQRLSNFLLWNAAYAELYFSDVLWPDFDDECVQQALTWYSKRSRRFGGRHQKQQPVVAVSVTATPSAPSTNGHAC